MILNAHIGKNEDPDKMPHDAQSRNTCLFILQWLQTAMNISFYERIKIHSGSEENPMAKNKFHNGVYQMT